MKTEYLKLIIEYLNVNDYGSAIDKLLNELQNSKEPLKEEYFYLSLAYILSDQIESFQSLWLSLLLEISQNEIDTWIEELVQFLEKKVSKFLQEEKLEEAKTLYESLQAFHSSYENPVLSEELINAIYSLASNLSLIQKYENAIEVYQEILNLNPNHSFAWHSLALCYYNLDQYFEAKLSINKAIELNPDFVQNYHTLGLILEKMSKDDEAIFFYQKAINKDYVFLDSYTSLAHLYIKKNQPEKSIEIYEKFLEYSPQNSFVLEELGKIYQSIENNTRASYCLGYSVYFSGQVGCLYDALTYFETVYFDTSKSSLKNINFYIDFSNCYAMSNQTKAAILLLEEAINLFPEKKLTLTRVIQSSLPVLYENEQQIDFYRNHFNEFLDKLTQKVDVILLKSNDDITPQEKSDLKSFITIRSNFYLAYQNKNELFIQARYSKLVQKIVNRAFPQWCSSVPFIHTFSSRKIRIGLVSCRLEGLGILYLGWLKYIDKSKFEVYVYNIVQNHDESFTGLKSEFKKYSDEFRIILISIDSSLLCNIMLNDQLDILIFPDLGMDGIISFLSFLRLSPIQCATWGHPVTSGSPTIDYFISSDLMEPANADEHYSEKLVRLPNLGFSIPSFSPPAVTKCRLDFQLKEDSIIYFCSQSLFKYLPQHDYVLPAIAEKNPRAEFVFVDPMHGRVVTEVFQKRLEKAFQEFGLDFRHYCTFLPRQSRTDFVTINQLADVFLDCLSWSGGLTTRDALSCGLPVVTRPGEFMRGRHSYAMLKMIGVTETIAETEEEYIEIAVRLGLDTEWRQQIKTKILANKNRLFDDRECIRGLESFCQQALQDLANSN
ncbi:tetratricopeptide repeat protein [Synechocystis sp. LKSZ1]|uniref:O-linked N-acetylglucosamine transferase family protein n=1 Tax=Synechocystis sp. LKSZ1 TaxID=3144951 RepID=UPI00336BD580